MNPLEKITASLLIRHTVEPRHIHVIYKMSIGGIQNYLQNFNLVMKRLQGYHDIYPRPSPSAKFAKFFSNRVKKQYKLSCFISLYILLHLLN